ncbi:MAG TPA: hypothetical protein VGE51_01875 [Fontimonas sp.]
MTADTLPFAVQFSPDRKYLTVRIPVDSLPAALRKQPSAMNVRLGPERPEVRRKPWQSFVPDFLLELARG